MNGQLRLSTASDGGRTVTDELFFTPPFKLYSPFYENGCAKYIQMSASAGVLGGDENEITLTVGDRCRVIYTDQGYQKLFNTDGGCSSQRVEISLGEGAYLRYMPHPVMTFSGCEHTAHNRVCCKPSAALVFSEIYCCGRTAMGERFALKSFRSRTEIFIGKRLDFLDNTLIDPSRLPLTALGFFEGCTHSGFMYIYTPNGFADTGISDDEENIGVSRTVCGCVVRMLGTSGEEIFERFQKIAERAALTK